MELEDKYAKLKGLLEQETYPKPYMYKFVIESDPDKEAEVKACFNSDAQIKLNQSKTGKYTTISIVEQEKSAQDIIDKYMKVAHIDKVIHI